MYYLVNYFCSLTRQAKETKSFRFRGFQVFRNSKRTKTTKYLVLLGFFKGRKTKKTEYLLFLVLRPF